MADINYFLKSWRVTNDGGQLLGPMLPKKGSAVKIELQSNGLSKTYRLVATSGAKKVLKDLKFQKGRLELAKPNYVLIIEEAKSNGKPGLRARAQQGRTVKAPLKPLPQEDMTGSWGAEANPGSGGGRGQVEPEPPQGDAAGPQPEDDMTGSYGAETDPGGGKQGDVEPES